jgi:ssDNA-binding replication factor A large subunit
MIKDLQQGDVIRIKHGYIKEGLRGTVEYHVGRRSEIETNPKDSDLAQLDLSEITQRPAVQAGRVTIGQIDDDTEGKTVEVCGIVVAVARTSPVYASCPNCRKKTEERDGKYFCAVCGKVDKPEYRMLYKVTLDDGSGSIRVTLFGKAGEDLLQMTAKEAQELVVKSGNKTFPMEQNSDKMLGRYVTVHGRINKFRDALEVSASDLLFVDPVEEIRRMREDMVGLVQ